MSVNPTAIWRVRPSGSNTNGGGYDAAISGAGTDYSQQNSAQASGTAGTAAGTTAFSDVVAAAFTSAMVGNALYITGTGLTTGWYFCTAFTDSGHITIDRSPGTGTTGTWHLGGGWADSFYIGGSGPQVPGNTIYILGSGIPNPASYTYDISTSANGYSVPNGSATDGSITYANDPATPSYGAGGMPVIRLSSGSAYPISANFITFVGLYFVNNGGTGSSGLITSSTSWKVIGCVFDQFGADAVFYCGNSSSCQIIGCEVFSSVSHAAGSYNAIEAGTAGLQVYGCNIHDCITNGIKMGGLCTVLGTSIAKCGGYGVSVTSAKESKPNVLINCTIDGNSSDGVQVDTQATLSLAQINNNIISNHTTAGKYGLTIAAGTAAQNSASSAFVDYNVYYNNTSNYNAISAGPHDTALGTNPYVGQSTENYQLS